jgi:hypothetical protein
MGGGERRWPEGHRESAGRALAAVHQPEHSLLAPFIQYSTSNQISPKMPRALRISPSFASMAILLLP